MFNLKEFIEGEYIYCLKCDGSIKKDAFKTHVCKYRLISDKKYDKLQTEIKAIISKPYLINI